MKPLAIVGSHPKTRMKAPWGDKKWDFWVIGDAGYVLGKPIDGLLQIHDREVYTHDGHKGNWHWYQKAHNFPIWMQKPDPEVPASVEYPLQEIVDKLLPTIKQGKEELTTPKPFSSSVAYLLALAIFQGRTKIGLWGIELANYEEYFTQRETFMFWIGYMAARGIDLEIHCADNVFNIPLYGYETNKEREMELTVWERVHLLNILPREGDLLTIRLGRKLREDLSFSEDEIKNWSIVQKGDAISWSPDSGTKEITISEQGRKMITNAFKALDENKKFTDEMLLMYERFVQEKEPEKADA